MIKIFFWKKENALFAWGILAILLALTSAQVYMSVLFNEWYKGFYNSLENKDLAQFTDSLWTFGWLAAIYILIATFSVFIAQHYCFRWRQVLTFDYLPRWQKASAHIEGASQRIQEDTMRFASMLYRLGLGFFRAVLTLLAFIPILWQISDGVPFFGMEIPGFLVWVALVTSVGGMGVSIWVGRKLPRLEYNNQRTEAAFRKSLVYGEDDRSLVSMGTLSDQFGALKANYFALYSNYKWFSLWENSYSQASVLIPYLAGASPFFAGAITLGGLVQISNAFNKVHDSFSFFLSNWTSVTELRSVVMRLNEFEKAVGDG
jgi:peptide/bleomycin uptake transporter